MKKSKDKLVKAKIFQQVLESCEKKRTCFRCREYNGKVLKVLKIPCQITHDKFNEKQRDSELLAM